MVKVETVKCPNCGGNIQGTGQISCPYCGSTLDVTAADPMRLTRVRSTFGTSGRAIARGGQASFDAMPGVVITPQTKDIPFRPTINYGPAAGNAALRAGADAVVELARKTHEAVNTENMDLYVSTLYEGDRDFYDKARQAANDQFVQTDMKRYSRSLTFKTLTMDEAVLENDVEALIFFPTGAVNHLGAIFVTTFRNVGGQWKAVASRVRAKGAGAPCGMLVALIGPAVGLIIGLGAAVFGIYSSCRDHHKETAKEVTPGGVRITETSPAATATAEEAVKPGPAEKGYYVARTGIPLYREAKYDSSWTTIMAPGAKFKVLFKKGEWYRLKNEDGAEGWAPEVIMKDNLK